MKRPKWGRQFKPSSVRPLCWCLTVQYIVRVAATVAEPQVRPPCGNTRVSKEILVAAQGIATSGYLVANQTINIQRHDTEERAPARDGMRDIGRRNPFQSPSKSIVSSCPCRVREPPPMRTRSADVNTT